MKALGLGSLGPSIVCSHWTTFDLMGMMRFGSMLFGYVGNLKAVLSTACFGSAVLGDGFLSSLGDGFFSFSLFWPFFFFCFDGGSLSSSVASVSVVSLASVDVASAFFFVPFCWFFCFSLSTFLEPSPLSRFASSFTMALRILRPLTQSLQSHVSCGRASLTAEESSESASFLQTGAGVCFFSALGFFFLTQTSSSEVSLSSIADDSSFSVVASSSEVSSTSVSEDSLGLIDRFLRADLSGLRSLSKLTFFRDEDDLGVACLVELVPLRRPGYVIWSVSSPEASSSERETLST